MDLGRPLLTRSGWPAGSPTQGLIDSHMHLESTLPAPAELARLVLPHGTTATISDSHEIGNVLGLPGIDMLLRQRGLPLDLFLMASSCVPATRVGHAGGSLGPDEVAALLDRPRMLGLAEVMDIPAVLAGDPDAGQAAGRPGRRRVLDGHAPGADWPAPARLTPAGDSLLIMNRPRWRKPGPRRPGHAGAGAEAPAA